MAKHKAGLHKKVSSIFDGVPVPKGDVATPVAGKSMPAYVPPTTTLAPPRPSPVAPAPSLPQAPKAPSAPQAPKMAPPPPPMPPSPRQEPAVAPIKHYKLDPQESVGAETFWSRIQAQVKEKLLTPKEGVDRKRQLVAVAMIPVLIIVLVIVVPGALKTPGAGKAPTGGKLQTPIVQANAVISWKFPDPYVEGLRDPTKPGTGPEILQAGIGDLVLTGIVFSDDRRSAIIGTKMLHEGDKVLVNQGESVVEFLIIRIYRDAVEYEAQGTRWKQEPGREVQMITGAAQS